MRARTLAISNVFANAISHESDLRAPLRCARRVVDVDKIAVTSIVKYKEACVGKVGRD